MSAHSFPASSIGRLRKDKRMILLAFFLLLLSSASAQCPFASEQAQVDLTVRFYDSPDTSLFGILDWSQMTSVNDQELHFDEFSPQSTYEQRFCLPRNRLHEIYVDSTGTDGQADGEVDVDVNTHPLVGGLEILDRSQSGFLYSDGADCSSGKKRFTLALRFGDFPEEISWAVRGKTGVLVMSSSDTYQAGESVYTDVFEQAPLLADKCLETGDYTFAITSDIGDGLTGSSRSGEYSIYVDNVMVVNQNQNFGAGDIQSFNIKTAAAFPGGFGCFSGQSLVHVKGRGEVPLRSVRLGDYIMTDGTTYEPIYSFGHYDTNVVGDFIRILPSGLELTPNHMIFLENGSAIPASKLRVGSTLANGIRVESIEPTRQQGMFAPFTRSGYVIVNGVKASNYIAMQDSLTLQIGSMSTPLSLHWLAHASQASHRIWCSLVGSACLKEEYNDVGISRRIALPLRWALWWLEQSHILILISLLPLIMTCMLVFSLELLLSKPGAFFCAAVALLRSTRGLPKFLQS